MKRTTTILTATALTAGLGLGALGLGAVLPGVAGAQGTSASAEADPASTVLGSHPRLRALVRHEGKVAADTIGVPATELRADLKGGQSISEVAEAHGVATQTVVDAIVADVTAKLDHAVDQGTITRERADRIEQRLPDRVTTAVNRHRGDRAAAPTD